VEQGGAAIGLVVERLRGWSVAFRRELDQVLGRTVAIVPTVDDVFVAGIVDEKTRFEREAGGVGEGRKAARIARPYAHEGD
jgi:hypothetical protein